MNIFRNWKRISATFVLGLTQVSTVNAAREDNQFNLNKEFETAFGYSIATQAGCLIYIGGIVSVDADGELVGGGDVEAQTTQIYKQLEAVLKAHKLTLKNVVQESFYLTDINKMQFAGAVRAEHYAKAEAQYPSTVGMEISKLGMPGAEVEMTAVAEQCNSQH
jgi:enamine deaminase RidA (YjgF/YER057c/UK114 family)